MRAAIYNPYLDTLGGGERYTMAVATTLEKHGFTVDVEWKDTSIKEKLEQRLGIDLNNINFVSDVKRGDGYEVCFWVSDGSVPTLKSRINLLHFQVPFTNVSGTSLLNKFKLMRINKIIVNSEFTKKIIDKEFNVDSFVLYPPVSIEKFKPQKKEDTILSVARFSELMQPKRQDVLIEAFKKLHDDNHTDWKLVLVGGVEVGSIVFLKKLKESAKNYPIRITESPDFKNLKNLYGTAKVFWSAAGFGIDEDKTPQKAEHFGIAAVESMASGCIPIIFNAGGHKESVKNNISGFLWNNMEELFNFTEKSMSDEKIRRQIAKESIERSRNFSYDEFEKKFSSLI